MIPEQMQKARGMRLLIITQAVDTEDPVLGFFVRWVEELAKQAQSIEVICLKRGKFNFPENVRVHSLGKEKGVSRVRHVLNFYKYIWQLRHDYDSVFVHMNQEYVLLGGIFWKLFRKRIYLWRNHAKGSLLTRIAITLSEKVFYTSPQSYTARFKNAVQMPVGIDTDFFTPDESVQKKPDSILFLGRIAPVKNVVAFIDLLHALDERGINFSATIAGSALSKDIEYEKTVHEKVSAYTLADKVRFIGPVSQEGARDLYREHEICVNLTPSGSFDKTIGEAMASGCVVVCANRAMEGVISTELLVHGDQCESAANSVGVALSLSLNEHIREVHKLRMYIEERHSLRKLVDKLEQEL